MEPIGQQIITIKQPIFSVLKCYSVVIGTSFWIHSMLWKYESWMCL